VSACGRTASADLVIVDVLLKRVVGYSEIDLIKKSPNFVDGYYENNHLLYEKWSRETGIQ
jgi:hypothetical protein